MSMNTRLPVFEELQGHIEILEEEGHDVLETLKVILDESFDCEIVEKSKFEELEKEVVAYRKLMEPFKPTGKLLSLEIDCLGICKCGTQVFDDEKHCHICAQKLDWENEKKMIEGTICDGCKWYDNGDSSAGLESGCTHDFLYDNENNFIEEHNNIIVDYMAMNKCPLKEV